MKRAKSPWFGDEEGQMSLVWDMIRNEFWYIGQQHLHLLCSPNWNQKVLCQDKIVFVIYFNPFSISQFLHSGYDFGLYLYWFGVGLAFFRCFRSVLLVRACARACARLFVCLRVCVCVGGGGGGRAWACVRRSNILSSLLCKLLLL